MVMPWAYGVGLARRRFDMGYGHRLIGLCGLTALLACANPATAAGAAALVLELTGGQLSGVQPYSEIAEGTTVTIPAGGRLVFQHYASCRKVAVAGGSVAFTSDGYTITGGTKESEVRVSCPRKVTLKASGEAAGVVLRSVGTDPAPMSSRPRASCRARLSCWRQPSTGACSGGRPAQRRSRRRPPTRCI